MSRFFSDKFKNLKSYVPGEQPKDRSYIKLNTNESPYPPSKGVMSAVADEAKDLMLYSDPDCKKLVDAFCKVYKIDAGRVVFGNGSDEILNFAFMAFSDDKRPLAFADITYGFYPVFANLSSIPYEEIPLNENFEICVDDYIGINKNIVIANPNAPTGIALPLCDIERIVRSNPDNIIIVDEAYVDFGGESAVGLTEKYSNLLVVGTFSKSRSLAGGRLGFGVGCQELISDLNTIRFSTNPYNINRMTMSAGAAALSENLYYMDNANKIIKTREYVKNSLQEMGFEVTDSSANFLFARSYEIAGEELYLKLKESGVLIRHFTKDRIKEYNRITIGTREEMDTFLLKTKKILEEKRHEKL